MSRSPRILLTGATGFIGRQVLARLRAGGQGEVVAVGHLRSTARDPGLALQCDLAAPDSIETLRTIDAEVVVHLAALMPGPLPNENSLQSSLATNVLATAHLAQACTSARYFVYVSTVDVYGTPEYLPLDERHPTNPTTYYGVTKLAAEKLMGIHCRMTGAGLLVVRLTQTYGPGEPPVKLIPKAVARVAAGQPPELFGDGSDLRDYLHVSDVSEAICRAIQLRPLGILNLASGSSRRAADVARIVLRVGGLEADPVQLPRRKPCVDLVVDVSLARQALGSWPLKDFEEGVRDQYSRWIESLSSLPITSRPEQKG